MKKVFLITAFASILLAGCSNDESLYDSKAEIGKDQLSIVVGGIGTRAIKNAFGANDEIGVFVTGTGYTSAVVNYQYDATSWVPSSGLGSGIKLIGYTANVYAFFPITLSLSTVSASGTFPLALPPADDFSATSTPDYLWGTGGVVSNQTLNITNVSTLTLEHSLAKVSFILNSDSTYPIIAGSAGLLSKIELLSAGGKLVTEGAVKVGDGTFTPTAAGTAFTYTGTKSINVAGSTDITAYLVATPVNYATGDLVLKLTIDGKTMIVTGFPVTPDWSDASKNYVYTIRISPTELVVANSVVINDWTATSVPGLTAQ